MESLTKMRHKDIKVILQEKIKRENCRSTVKIITHPVNPRGAGVSSRTRGAGGVNITPLPAN